MGRAWQAIDSPDKKLSEETVSTLFAILISPFGEEHHFSCIPTELLPETGRPGMDWPFITQTTEALFESWRAPPEPAEQPPKRRRAEGGSIFDAFGKGGGKRSRGGKGGGKRGPRPAAPEELTEEDA